MSLGKGAEPPVVSAHNQHGELVEPEFEEPTVLYFYPKDDTPGCTIEAQQFNHELETYQDAGVTVYGVSIDDVDSHREFAEKHGLEFDLLADPDKEIADAYEVETGPGGTTKRTTFVIVDGAIHRVYDGVNPDGHARQQRHPTALGRMTRHSLVEGGACRWTPIQSGYSRQMERVSPTSRPVDSWPPRTNTCGSPRPNILQ